MTYEEIVHCVRNAYENADAREIYEHIAVQVNVTGEGAGAFYIEVAGRAVCVEPYDYYDRDGLITASSETIVDIAKGDLSFEEAMQKGLLRLEGNMDKFGKLAKIKPEIPHKKRVAKAEKKEVKTEAKVEKKEELKTEAKVEKKELKAEAKAEKKEVKTEAKAEKKELKAEAKVDKKEEVKAEAKP
ncbi:MAG: SCP2 sterol-binding domain-containing protein [Lachnospiraceae bacterium]|nr:SCP2 sterol-binding domain-containing protein [Lachnospiraceae bacterium]